MEMKTRILDKKHLLIIVISIFSIIISYFNVTYAFFEDSKNQPISIKSAATFGEYTVHEPGIFIEGKLTYTTDKTNMLSVKNIEVVESTADTYDFLLTVATQIDPRNTEYKDNEYSSISYEIYHKTSNSIDTANATCTESKYTNESGEDTCNTGTYIENSLNGLPFELIKDYKITDTNTHYFDIYIYLNNETAEEKNIKTRIFYLDKGVEKPAKPIPPDIDNTGLVPIKYNDTSGKWVVTTQDDPEWYNYDNQKWANAASIKSGVITEENPYPELTVPDGTSTDSDILAMFVWIPRYSYTIGCADVNENGDGEDDGCYGYRMNDNPDTDPGVPSQQLPGAIDIKFVAKNVTEDDLNTKDIYPTYTYNVDSNGMPTTDRNPTNYYTHPAFNFGGTPLSGIWVGKFETSTDVNASCYNFEAFNCAVGVTEVRILPNVTSMRYQQIANQFAYSKYFTSNELYGLTGDSHMMKNSEWAAVAYLSQSIYGKYGNSSYSGANKEIYKNDSSSYYTGRSQGNPSASASTSAGSYKYNVEISGTGASTTGNIYGVYDMSGGTNEYVMGNFNNTESSSGFTFTTDNVKYYDRFTIDTPFNKTVKEKEITGQALYEVASWYGDNTKNFDSTFAWLIRGGNEGSSNAGAFNGFAGVGFSAGNDGFRSVFVMTST